MKTINKFIVITLSLATIALAGCHHDPVLHLASDVCLLSSGVSQQEVISYLGIPQERRLNEQGNEVWIYYQVNKRFLRKTPFIGDRLGDEDFDLVTVTFLNGTVSTCAYHSYTEEEVNKLGLIIPDEK